MQAHEMKKIETAVKYLAEHIDEYTYDEFQQSAQDIADDSWKNVWDKRFDEVTVRHLKDLVSLYRYLKMGMYE